MYLMETVGRVRWSIRYLLLVPMLTLLLCAVGVSTWVAVYSARRAVHEQIQEQVRRVARSLAEAHYPLTENVLGQLRELTEADFVLRTKEGREYSTRDAVPPPIPSGVIADSWQETRLGPSVHWSEQSYLVTGIRFTPGHPSAGAVLLSAGAAVLLGYLLPGA